MISNQVCIGSTNPIKARAVHDAFGLMMPTHTWNYATHDIESGVSKQPMTDRDTLKGAKNRVYKLRQRFPDFEYWVGIEGGITKVNNKMFTFTWTAVLRKDDVLGIGSGPRMELIPNVSSIIQQGEELGVACDIVFGGVNNKHKDGYIGLATGGIITRLDVTRMSVMVALTRFVAEKHYTK